MKIVYALIFAAILILGGVFYYLNQQNSADYEAEVETETTAETSEVVTEPVPEQEIAEAVEERGPETVIGTTVQGHEIIAHHFGDGEQELLFVGGTHGGYSFNTALVAFEIIDHLTENPNLVPDGYTVTVIPVLNPDGLEAVVGTHDRFDGSAVTTNDSARVVGRFNANEVDLNRNFDCEWSETGTWQDRSVSGGSAPFSERETQAIRDYVATHDIAGAVVYYSQAGGVYASQCGGETLPETAELTAVYAQASGYDGFAEFDFYEITGDMVNWFAKENIPAISVLLTDHENTEWNKNRAGVEAFLGYFGE